jgi:methyl-accepting chemotaxis protein
MYILVIVLSVVSYQGLLMEQNFNINAAAALIIYIDIVLSILFFLTKWGKALVDSSVEKEKKTTELLEKLKKTMDEIDKGSEKLDGGVHTFNDNIQNTKEGMSNINTAMHEIAKGVTEQAEGMQYKRENNTDKFRCK